MGGGTSKKYEGMTCHSCYLPATVKSFLDGSYVPMCEEHDEITKAKAKAKESRFHPTSFIDDIPIPTDNTDNIVTNFLRGDVIVLIGPRKERSVVIKQPVQRQQPTQHQQPVQHQQPTQHQPTQPRPLPKSTKQQPYQPKFLLPDAAPAQEQVVHNETKTDANSAYQPKFLLPNAAPVQENFGTVGEQQQYYDPNQYQGEQQQYYDPNQYEEAYSEAYEEPLSWRWTAEQQQEQQQEHQQQQQPSSLAEEDIGSMSIGMRHCRYNRCPCSAFHNDSTKPTCCSQCNHGEMYHRSKTEAPLARANVPGSGNCLHCTLPIIGGGFSGWYKEPKVGGIVHDECWDLYKKKNKPKCQQCGMIICKNNDDGFSGRYSKVSFGEGAKVKVHKECLQVYLACKRGDEY